MRKSIHRFLTVNLLISVSLSILLGIVGSFHIKHRNIYILLDTELSIGAHVIESLIFQRLSPSQIPTIQRKINQIPSETLMGARNASALNKIAARLVNSTQFQIWDMDSNRLIIRSPSAPAIPLQPDLGYKDIFYQKRQWRTYSVEVPEIRYKIVTMQQHDLRLGFEKQVIYENLRILTAIFIILIVSTRIIVKRALFTLGKMKTQLEANEPYNLDPISLKGVPEEVYLLTSEINRLMKELQTMLERERRFASDAAHELKTPLAAMKAHVQLAQEQHGESQHETLRRIEEIIDRYDHIIRQLLSLSRTISQSALTDNPPIDLVELTKSIVSQAAPIALKRDMQIAFECLEESLKFAIDPHVYSVIASNIIDNASKYTQKGDCILVRLEKYRNHVTLVVIDHGPGISDTDKPLVIQRFKRIYGSKASGSGLGLNIVSEVLKKISGRLILKDTLGGGLTTFVEIDYPTVRKDATHDEDTI